MTSTPPYAANSQTSIPPQRLAEIASWLQRRTTPEEAIAALEADDATVIQPSFRERFVEGVILLLTGLWIVRLIWKIVEGRRRTSEDSFRAWLATYDLTSDELWEYDTGDDSWENLQGECGFAIVRHGVVTDFWMSEMN